MSLPHEHYNSIVWTERFLYRLMSGRVTRNTMREEARRLLRHYPCEPQVARWFKIPDEQRDRLDLDDALRLSLGKPAAPDEPAASVAMGKQTQENGR